MPNPPEKYKWLCEDYPEDFNQTFKPFQWPSHLIEDSMEISDLTSMVPSDIIVSPVEISFYSPISPKYQGLIEDLSIDDRSTQLFKSDKAVINLEDIAEYKKQFANSLLQLIHEEIFEFGMENAADIYIQENLRDNPFLTKEWLNSFFLDYFADVGVVTGLLRIIAHLDYTDINPTGPTMALAALSHKNAEVRANAAKALISGRPEAIPEEARPSV